MTNDTLKPTKPQNERRQFRRHPALKLKAEVKIKKGIFGQWIDVEPRDYSKRGMAIETQHVFSSDQPITLNITLEMEIGDIQIAKVAGIVKNKIDNYPSPRYGIEFDFNVNRHMKSIETKSQLGRIEGILERSENLRLRIEDQQGFNED